MGPNFGGQNYGTIKQIAYILVKYNELTKSFYLNYQVKKIIFEIFCSKGGANERNHRPHLRAVAV